MTAVAVGIDTAALLADQVVALGVIAAFAITFGSVFVHFEFWPGSHASSR